MGRWELKTEGCKVPLARDSESGEWIGHSEVADFFVDAHNADCDAYEQRIAELEAKALIDCNEYLAAMDCNYNIRAEFEARIENLKSLTHEILDSRESLEAELVRVRAESLRNIETNNTKDDKQ